MYMSLISLEAANSYQQHQAIWSLFPKRPDGLRDHLFRIESVERGMAKALLQSATKPVASEGVAVLQTKEFTILLEKQAHYRFKITANPTKKISKSGRLLDLCAEDEQIQWLQRKLEGANVTVTSVDPNLVNYRDHQFTRLVTFEGVMQIEDLVKVQGYVMKGIGRKKHAGAGLLSLARMV